MKKINKKILIISLMVIAMLVMAVPMVFAGLDWSGGGDLDDGTIRLIGTGMTGFLHYETWGIDETAGYVGSWHMFNAEGSFDVDLTTYTTYDAYGTLNTHVNAESNSEAMFSFLGRQDFDLSNGHASEPYMRVGELSVYAYGSEGASLTAGFVGSMYIFKADSVYTYPSTANPRWMVQGEGDYDVDLFVGVYDKWKSLDQGFDIMYPTIQADYTAMSSLSLSGGDGEGMFGMSTSWAQGTQNSGNAYYPGTTMYAQASGGGDYNQFGYGDNYLNLNGIEMASGGLLNTGGWFVDEFEANPSFSGN